VLILVIENIVILLREIQYTFTSYLFLFFSIVSYLSNSFNILKKKSLKQI